MPAAVGHATATSTSHVWRLLSKRYLVPCKDTHAVSATVGPRGAHLSQNERTRAARAARGGGPAGPAQSRGRSCRATQGPTRLQAQLFRELLFASRREHALHGRLGVVSRARSGPPIGPTLLPQTHADGRPASAPSWSHIVACRGASVALWCAWSRARPREAPWRTAAAGHVTGPAPQGRPPGCTRSARALILSPVSPCGPNYYRNRVRAIAWQCHGVVKEVPNMVRLK